MQKKIVYLLLAAVLSFSMGSGQESSRIRVSAADSDGISRVLIESSRPLRKTIEQNGAFLFIKIRTDSNLRFERQSIDSRFIRNLTWTPGLGTATLTIETLNDEFTISSYSIDTPPQLFINISPHNPIQSSRGARIPPASLKSQSTSPSVLPERKTIVIDPGHGGMKSGAQGKLGTLEKNLTLDIAKKLKVIIEKGPMYNVILTRDSDVLVSLESRAAIANNQKADYFVSIHINGSNRKKAHGSETYFLSLNATDEEARRLAYMENNSEELGEEILEDDSNDIKMILWDMAQAAYLRQSSVLAEMIQKELNSLLGTADRGVKQAPFKVLSGVACPAVLVEVAFLSNSEEEKKLQSPEFQHNVAQAIFRGLDRFIRSRSGV